MVILVSKTANRTERLGLLFVAVTGRSTVTERQQSDHPNRFDEQREVDSIATYIGAMATEDGLEDAIQEPERY